MKTRISTDLMGFVEALRRGDKILCAGNKWWVEGSFKAFFRRIMQNETNHLISLAESFEKTLDEVEKIPIQYTLGDGTALQAFDVDLYIEAARLIIRNLTPFRSSEAIRAKNQLSFKLISLRYRLEEVNGGIDVYPIQASFVNILKRLVYKWKLDHAIIADDEKEVNARELLEIQVTSQYPEFIQLLLHDEEIRESYMLWMVRDKNKARSFIEYPALTRKLIDCNLNGRIGRMGGEGLKIIKETFSDVASIQKVVTLPFDGIDVNILDETREIVFAGNYRLTVGEVLKIFEDKTYRVGNLEYLAHGITNWNVHKWGIWDNDLGDYKIIDLKHIQWWQQLPLFEILSQEDLFKRYGKRLDGTAWCVAATATRGSRTLDYENTHAFLEVAIPWGDGRYAVYDFGKFAIRFPSSFADALSMFCDNLHATVAYPDENVFYSQRQIAHHAYVINPEQGQKMMEMFKEDMLKAQKKNFIYQIESENCAKWVHKILESVVGFGVVPDMFRMHLLDTEPFGPTSSIFKLIKRLPESLQTPVMAYCHIPMGATKETFIIENGRCVRKSLMQHSFFETGIVYLPALLHKKKEDGFLEGLSALKEVLHHRVQLAHVRAVHLLGKTTGMFYASFKQVTKLVRFFLLSVMASASASASELKWKMRDKEFALLFLDPILS